MFKSKKVGNGLIYYSDLIPELEHFFTGRDTNVDDNFDLICKYLGVAPENLIHPNQTHSSNVDFAKVGQSEYKETDALILTNFEQAVYLRFADCTPVILYDKKANIGAIAHAGWRGTVAQIVPKTVQKMIEYTKSDLSDIYAVVGPAIGLCCYEVGDEVVDGIKQSVKNTKDIIVMHNGKPHVDLKRANAKQLTEFGVPQENIDICPYCTSCDNDKFFSYRKEHGTTHRHNAVIKLIHKP